MPYIVGPKIVSNSTNPPLDAHVLHLRHLTNPSIARKLLQREFRFTAKESRDVSALFCAQIEQSLHFHEESRLASIRIRPVLQYYSYLNLAVAVILAYRPTDYNQYRKHGVEDKSHNIKKFEFASKIVKVRSGVVPLFHSIISDDDIKGRTFRVGSLVAGIHMLGHELKVEFNKDVQRTWVQDSIENNSNRFYSQVKFENFSDQGEQATISTKRLENAMPLLASHYSRHRISPNSIIYKSTTDWPSKEAAETYHRKNCMKFVNYGGHQNLCTLNEVNCQYFWIGVSHVPLLPTLTSLLLFSFSLSSLVRYRPTLLNLALQSQYQLLIDTFVQESDGMFFPTVRNLLYRQEFCAGSVQYM